MHPGRVKSRALSLATGSAMMLLATEARADIPIPAVFGFVAPSWLALLTFGVSLAVVVVAEGLVLFALMRVGFRRALGIALIANVITTAYGFIHWSGAVGTVILTFFLAVILLPITLNEGMRRYRALSFLLIAAPVPVMLAMYPLGILFLGQSTAGLFLSLLPALCLTTLIEVFVIRTLQPGVQAVRGAAVANGTSYALIALTLWGAGMRGEENPMLTPDYLTVMEVPRRIAADDMEGVFEIAQQIRAFHLGTRTVRGQWLAPAQLGLSPWVAERGYPPWNEQRIARSLAAKGHIAEAIDVLEYLLEAPHLREDQAEIVREEIAELEARLRPTDELSE